MGQYRELTSTNAIDYMLKKDNRFLLHVVNCQGVMGSGIALEIKNRIPRAYDLYRQDYIAGELVLGCVSCVNRVANLAAQFNFGRGERHLNYGALAHSISLLIIGFSRNNVNPDSMEFVIPYKMGADRAGGDWEIVKEIVMAFCDNVTVCAIGDIIE